MSKLFLLSFEGKNNAAPYWIGDLAKKYFYEEYVEENQNAGRPSC